MQRVGDSRLAATLVVGVSIALVAAAPAAGQLANDMGPLRSSLPDPSVTGSAGPSSNATARQTGFEVPTFGNPSGFGAGTTGFDSTGTARRKTRQKPKPGQLQPGTKPAITSARIAPATAPGTPGLRPTPQAERRGAPVIEAPPSLAPPPPIMVPQRRPVVDPTPFEPLGLRAGVFVIRPALVFRL